MKILVTGASGSVGSAVARDLLANGHEVRVLDHNPPAADIRKDAEVVFAEISDRFAIFKAVEGVEAVAHLAAIPNPAGGEHILMVPNIVGTQCVLEAAEIYGVKRVVLASTCALYGLPFAEHDFDFQYLRIDEEHPMRPQDLYSVSKQACELLAAAYTRRSGMVTTCMRINRVLDVNSRRMRFMRRMIEMAPERRDTDLWHYIDVRDTARAFRLALERVEEGHHKVHIVSRDIMTDHDPRDLLRRHFPGLERFMDHFDFAEMGFWDSRKAERLFGFVAQESWRTVLGSL